MNVDARPPVCHAGAPGEIGGLGHQQQSARVRL